MELEVIFLIAIPANRAKLGVNRNQLKKERFIMNDFISDLLFPVDLTKESEVAFCVEKLERVSIVTIKMTSNDAIVTTSNHNEDFLTTVALIGLADLFGFVDTLL